jgi:hypothetical protein
MTRVFVTKVFARFARRAEIDDRDLCAAVAAAQLGLIDADLGGEVIKQRLARRGAGKSGGYRTIILFRRGGRAFFVFGFAKSDRANLEAEELKGFRRLAKRMLGFTEQELAQALKAGAIKELKCDG